MHFRLYILIAFLLLFSVRSVQAEGIQTEASMEKLSLKIMTLNLHSGINWYGKYDLDGIVQFIQEVNPDLIAIQEVDRFWSGLSQYQDIPGELALRLKMFSAYSAALERNSGYFGNLILSRYPINYVWTDRLPGLLERRSFLFTQVMVNGVRVNFLTTHLGLSESDRLQQVNAIMQFLNQVSGPLVIAGDFNGAVNDPAVAIFEAAFLDSMLINGNPDQGTFRAKNGTIDSRMDYILTTPDFGLERIQVPDTYISDHLPVVVEVSLQVDQANVAGQPVYYQTN